MTRLTTNGKIYPKMRTLVLILLLFHFTSAQSQVLNLDGGVSLVAEKQINIVLTESGMRNEGVLLPDSSTVFIDGNSFTALSGSQPINFFNLRFRGTGTKQNEATTNVFNGLGIEGTTTLDADGNLNNSAFTLKSTKTATSFVDKITTGDIIGNVTVERFINTGTAPGEHGKSWQFLATPASGQSIFESWQEGGFTPAGFGTRISGNGLGFDVYSSTPALKFYNPASNSWSPVTNTFDPLQKAQGYMLFVRGDRTVTAYNDPANNTNMRSTGGLFRPNNPAPPVVVGVDQLQSFGNPYASRINFTELYNNSTGIYEMFYAWDPMLNGSYGLGGYQTLSGIAGYIPTAGDATVFYPAGVPAPYIESGQAVFVFAGAGGGTVNFDENIKEGGSSLVHRRPLTADSLPGGKSMLISRLLTNGGQMADGNILVFQHGLGNDVNRNDAPKLANGGENFGLMRNGKILAVEGREHITVTDTLFYYTTRLQPMEYILELQPVNMLPGLSGYFVDKYLNTTTPILLSDTGRLRLVVNSDAASRASDRFMIIFKKKADLPFHFMAIEAWAEPNGSNLIWFKVNRENDVRDFILERSRDGVHFQNASAINSTGSATVTEHTAFDQAPYRNTTYYRVRANTGSGPVYSSIVRVKIRRDPRMITFPNPARRAEKVFVILAHIPKGEYELSLLNNASQVLYHQPITHDGNYSRYPIASWNAGSGSYYVHLTNSSKNISLSAKLLVK